MYTQFGETGINFLYRVFQNYYYLTATRDDHVITEKCVKRFFSKIQKVQFSYLVVRLVKMLKKNELPLRT